MNKSLEWVQSLNYEKILNIYLLIIFGWNFVLPFLGIYILGEKALIIFGIFLLGLILVLLLKRKWTLLLVLGSIIVSTVIGFILIKQFTGALLIWGMMTWLIAGSFLILCGKNALSVPYDKRKTMVSRGIIMIIFQRLEYLLYFYECFEDIKQSFCL